MIIITQGNFGHLININVKDKSGKAIDLTASTVSMDFVYPDKIKRNYSLTVTNTTAGTIQLKTTAEMSAKVGNLKGYIDVVTPTSQITLDKPLEIKVIPNDGGVV